MDSRRLANMPGPARRRQAPSSLPPPVEDTSRSARDLLLRSWPGRLFIIATAFKLVISIARLIGPLPAFAQALNTAASIGLAFSLLFFFTRLVFLAQRRLLWRVRRKLILSYIFIGVVPALLILGFFLLSGWFLAGTVGAYLFHDGYEAVTDNVTLLADAAAAEIGRSPKTTEETVDRIQRNGSKSLRYPTLSILFVPAGASAPPAVSRGPWEHLAGTGASLPDVPAWVRAKADGFRGTTSVTSADASMEPELIVRAVSPAGRAGARVGWVIVDLPLDAAMMNRLYEETGVKAGAVSVTGATQGQAADFDAQAMSGFGRTVSRFDSVEWTTGGVRRVTVALMFRLRDLLQRLSQAQAVEVQGQRLADFLGALIVIVGVLFLIIELVALVMGLALARSITSSVHELFMGTERVRQGDFTHRINITTKDQLGELAESFNQMTGSIENLLQTAAQKKRLEEELRIARQIQMSLLPRGPLDMNGLSVTALCVPAREVGGDYYDFFRLGENRLGVLIADVAGKGTSAALYMAELKGLVLSLSQIYQSPRQLLIEANRILSENLDSRSFITMTYAVLDLANGTMTYARAGHTPLIYYSGQSAPAAAQVLVPNGMVLGLRIDGAAAKFAELLEEDQITLRSGDVIVFYTDGITEAMNSASDLFGEGRLSRLVEEHGHLESGELRERILREIEAFVGAADQHDDMTMILMKITDFEAKLEAEPAVVHEGAWTS
ncbi:MAG TPA: SpoIIE family protein phosphatase [Vicinamibacterales bacterium]|nr:SpoIIE family protein phosphatase [Vicinamibacterales bacterium]